MAVVLVGIIGASILAGMWIVMGPDNTEIETVFGESPGPDVEISDNQNQIQTVMS